jgi:hypothetical protein
MGITSHRCVAPIPTTPMCTRDQQSYHMLLRFWLKTLLQDPPLSDMAPLSDLTSGMSASLSLMSASDTSWFPARRCLNCSRYEQEPLGGMCLLLWYAGSHGR